MVEIIHKEISYRIGGLLFKVHNELGRYCREKQYGDALEKLLKSEGIPFKREEIASVEMIENKNTNKVDFIVDDKVILELKAKPFVLKEDYYQTQKYLQASGHKLGLIVNFRNKYLKPIRIIRMNS
ncbi:MAG: hypothetical protein A3F53_02610 [Candidatus Zambryskibacteria bacterium RIFCSPHIGHO2_12_FULL_48_10]|uniref:GxxExxY protein n=1 Tax=Candidatus Zambryskibacteria bacterium RIFCSPHIGHO2_01_FULL_46_25 TaxID=1802738 RepID=A0A1G2T080_9BACT|nr:MAG: GTP-binding signal recognition particle [Parcubacteria group bacterium GW2011_GWA1_47_10]OHA90685.1 MAG: hypothetical protein A2838_03170 [Candidatus Zambryskibacteria bacterium RIFCSPHIGHO2_01_FULL_46_25]OHB02762.1 MAG: hypothetical protein A3F53_02610 [Candidatus Zambryskibacteria bacterium RIFCSPHIGHO2_12_FULL_48_10]OHB07328.1 MAG: hypothetical protein A3A31_02310 [Candidatus Zambryskibacteria bacterium RIFCSPLOWO2_01_FULL_48_25]